MKTNVVILAQGRQERMGDSIAIPKQLVPLPACGNTPVLQRTLVQVARVLYGRDSLEVAAQRAAESRVTVLGWHEVHAGLSPVYTKYLQHPGGGEASILLTPALESLADPGNSSLKGIYRYLDARAMIPGVWRPDRTVVLLGDVIYAWSVLEGMFGSAEPMGFAGTRDISPSGGELWGVFWNREWHDTMMDALLRALDRHPPYQAYQPGQLRRWMWMIHPSFQHTERYLPHPRQPSDYTMDIDLPDHLAAVGETSVLAARDDLQHGVEW